MLYSQQQLGILHWTQEPIGFQNVVSQVSLISFWSPLKMLSIEIKRLFSAILLFPH